MSNRFGVDVGGTFTDLIHLDAPTGRIIVGKGPSTPSSPDEGVVAVVASAMGDAVLGQSEYFLHGTTVGINALLTRGGAAVGLITTDGFRDVLEIRRGDRGRAMYELLWKAPPPLVPRHRRLGVRERMAADGSVVTPLVIADVEAAVATLIADGVEAIAVVFINAHANPEHELMTYEAILRSGFSGTISLSHQVTGEMREYERTSTTVIDAYVRPKVSAYFAALDATLQSRGFTGESLVTRSGGGALTFAEAQDRPFETVMSGPVAGAVGAGALCRELGVGLGITADVGGTSFDACLIIDGEAIVRHEGEVEGMPLQAPWVDVRSIGAGGGSIASFQRGLLEVGPQSAGAVPGPACYLRGGTAPTVTDAAAVLGMMGHGQLAGGFCLDMDAAARVIGGLAEQMATAPESAAAGVISVANANMADTVRTIMTEVGEDPREAAVLAFGGAGPLFGCLLAVELGASKVIVPNYAGNFSAWSLLLQDIASSAARSLIHPLDAAGIAQVEQTATTLHKQLIERSGDSQVGGEAVPRLGIDLRYTGQEYSLTISMPDGALSVEDSVEEIKSRFENAYERSYGVRLDNPIQISAVRLTIRRPLPPVTLSAAPEPARDAARSQIDAYSFLQGRRLTFDIVDRSNLLIGSSYPGPLIVTEETTTTYVDDGFVVHVHPTGTLILERTI